MGTLDKAIRQVLLGRTKLLEDGTFSTLSEGDFMMPRGVVDGATAVRILGVARKAKILKSDLPDWKLKEAVGKTMQNIGRGVTLQEEPEARACLLRFLLSRPAVLCFSYMEDQPVIAAYTGRGLTGFVSLLRAFSRFRKELPDSIRFSEETAPDLRREERLQEKREKAARKHEKAEKKLAEKEARVRRKDGKKNNTEMPEQPAQAADKEGTTGQEE